jgi:hypothetical protein
VLAHHACDLVPFKKMMTALERLTKRTLPGGPNTRTVESNAHAASEQLS